MYKILVCSRSFGKYTPDGINLLKENNCEIEFNSLGRYFKEEDLLDYIVDKDGIIVSMDEVSKRVLDLADKLKIISIHGAGYDNIDVDYATKKGIYVANVPESKESAVAVADLTFALILSLARNLLYANSIVKSGNWKRIIGYNVGGKILGVIGTGRIGTEVIRRAKGFEMEILAYDLREDKDLINKFGVIYTSFENLLPKADFVSIHVPLTKKTKKLIGKRELDLMKPSSYLINTSRGEVVNEKDLILAIKNKKIAGAALDVFDPEPPSTKNPLLKFDNVITTPHYGSHTLESLKEVDYISAMNVIKVLKGEKPLYTVNNPNFINKK